MAGRICLVTGANTGLGFASAIALASRGATVHMLCRDRERGEGALAELRRLTGSPTAFLHVVDVSLVASIKAFASDWLHSGQPIHSA